VPDTGSVGTHGGIEFHLTAVTYGSLARSPALRAHSSPQRAQRKKILDPVGSLKTSHAWEGPDGCIGTGGKLLVARISQLILATKNFPSTT
ncbi:MAG: hypothetical protein V3W52_15765, partial [Syntrophobacteria bacterium]